MSTAAVPSDAPAEEPPDPAGSAAIEADDELELIAALWIALFA